MSRGTDDLVRMANQIASFFRGYGDDEAVAGVRNHLDMFWTPEMVRTLSSALPDRRADLDVLVVEAIKHWQ